MGNEEENMRMLDPEIFEQEWFDELPSRLKLLYIYILLKCDCGGVIEINLKRWSYSLGYENERFTRKEIFSSFGNRVMPVGGDADSASKAIVPDFIHFHYGDRLVNDRKHVMHRAAVKRIKAAGLTLEQVCEMAEHKFEFDDFSNVNPSSEQVTLTLIPKDDGGKQKKGTDYAKPTLEEVKAYFKEKGTTIDPEQFFAYYESKAGKDGVWRDKNKIRIKDWKLCLVTWEKREKGRAGGSSAAHPTRRASQNITVSSEQAEGAQRVLG